MGLIGDWELLFVLFSLRAHGALEFGSGVFGGQTEHSLGGRMEIRMVVQLHPTKSCRVAYMPLACAAWLPSFYLRLEPWALSGPLPLLKGI